MCTERVDGHELRAAYDDARALHGDLDLDLETWAKRLEVVVQHLLTVTPADSSGVSIRQLHTSDLYLALACARQSDRAWNRFSDLYHTLINDMASVVSRNRQAARELAANVMADLFLPSRAGLSRIASFDGRSTLATWLRVVISHHAINDRQLKYNSADNLDATVQMAEGGWQLKIEAAFRACHYGSMLRDAMRAACQELTARDRLLLLLRYDHDLRLSDIAHTVGTHQSTVRRQLDRIQAVLRARIACTLRNRYSLTTAALEECFLEATENPASSILPFVRQRADGIDVLHAQARTVKPIERRPREKVAHGMPSA